MKQITLMTTLVLALFVGAWQLPADAGTTSGDVARQTEDWLKTIKAYLIEKKNDAMVRGKELLNESDREIDKLTQKAATASDDAKAAYHKDIERLKEKRAVAARKLDEMGNATRNSWDDAKKGFAEAYQDLHDATIAAMKRFD